jgi:pyruvate dehydrogenase E2 component (dihydrolipoamide acetyltransferase)
VATEVKLPRLGQGMESGTIVRWLKREGDRVAAGEPLYELDTDKVTQEVEAESDGVLLQIVVAEGEVQVGSTIAVIGVDGEDVSLEPVTAPSAPAAPTSGQAEPETPPAASVAAPAPSAPAAPAAPRAPVATPPTGRVKASPLARRIARERGVDLAAVVGTGPDGRIVAEDVAQAVPGAPVPAVPAPAPAAPTAPATAGDGVEVVELSNVRATIARRLTEAWTAPVFQLAVSADMSAVLALREALVEATGEGDVRPTVNDVLTKLVAVSLARHPAVNAHFTGTAIHRHRAAHVGIAVAAPSGLIVPVVRDADRRTVREIARARADLVGRARDGKLTLADLEGGTFTISNLGMFGVEQFVAVLNPPQVAILAIGAAGDAPVVVDGAVTVRPTAQLTLTCDHRAIDGADGAEFLQTLVALVDEPALAL